MYTHHIYTHITSHICTNQTYTITSIHTSDSRDEGIAHHINTAQEWTNRTVAFHERVKSRFLVLPGSLSIFTQATEVQCFSLQSPRGDLLQIWYVICIDAICDICIYVHIQEPFWDFLAPKWIHTCMSYVTYMYELYIFHPRTFASSTLARAKMGWSAVTWRCRRCSIPEEACHIYVWVMSHICMSNVT